MLRLFLLGTQGQGHQRLTDFILQTTRNSDDEEEEEEPQLKDEEFARSLSSFGRESQRALAGNDCSMINTIDWLSCLQWTMLP